MSVHIGTGLSVAADPRAGALEAALIARDGLGDHHCDLVMLFVSGAHLTEAEIGLETVHEILAPDSLVGCGAAGVLGDRTEIEEGTAVSVWAASLGDGAAEPFHATVEPVEGGGALGGLPDLQGSPGVVLLPDPVGFPTEPVLRFLGEHMPTVPILGGVASARTADGDSVLFIGEDIVDAGAVGVRFDGVELLPCVSQGAVPVGPELTITAADAGVITELAGRPPLTKLRETIDELDEHETALMAGGLLIGIVVDGNKPEYVRGDFLVRGLSGADADSGAIAVGTTVRPGQVLRLHARDAASADGELREELAVRRAAFGGKSPSGGLMFACTGRGRGMFGRGNHDVRAAAAILGPVPLGGFFAAGEIGPVGGQPFLHTFTSTMALFA